MFFINVQEVYLWNNPKGFAFKKICPNSLLIFGDYSGDIALFEKLQDNISGKMYVLIAFPLIRRANYMENHIDIIIKPLFSEEANQLILEKDKLMGKRLVKTME